MHLYVYSDVCLWMVSFICIMECMCIPSSRAICITCSGVTASCAVMYLVCMHLCIFNDMGDAIVSVNSGGPPVKMSSRYTRYIHCFAAVTDFRAGLLSSIQELINYLNE